MSHPSSAAGARAAHLTSETHGDVLVLRVGERRLDARIAVAFKQWASTLVENGSVAVLDLTDVAFMDSSGLGAIVGVLKQCGRKGELALAGVRPEVLELLRLTRMDRVFVLHASVEEAVAALGPQAA